jgi:hypothetical protein
MFTPRNSVDDVFLLVLICVGFFLISILGYKSGKDNLRFEAVKTGAAKWVITTNEDGGYSTTFEWVVPVEKK